MMTRRNRPSYGAGPASVRPPGARARRPSIATTAAACALLLVGACSKDKGKAGGDQGATAPSAKPNADQPTDKPADAKGATIPITTASPEAKELYLKGQKLLLELRATDAHAMFEQAVAKDPKFALAALGFAQTTATNKEFFAALAQAVALAPGASEAEQLWITGVEAGAKNDQAGQKAAYEKLVAVAPGDPQSYNLLGNYAFGRQDYPMAIDAFTKAIAIDPKFTAAYNQLGYAYRFTGKLDEAEKTFKQYIELLPNDPNPYDSYGELLMKRGKYDESIASYQKALAIEPTFIASYIGIGNNHFLAGRGEEARAAFGKLTAAARTTGEKRQALFWTSVSYTHEGKWDDAIAAIDKEMQLALEAKDLGLEAGDHNAKANLYLEAGKPDAAAKEFEAELEAIGKADVPDGIKEANRRIALYDFARVALAKKDLAAAKAKHAELAKQVAVKSLPFEVKQQHELAGMIAIEEKKFPEAVAELGQANQRDPRVLYLQGVAYAGAGDVAKAKEMFQATWDFNELAGNLGHVRGKAKAELEKLAKK
jgi:tetratricopeptide (TPR) repeat protein